jgi:hypothetical protein
MWTLVLPFILVVSSLFSVGPGGDAPPQRQPEQSGGERCITDETEQTFPWYFEEGRDFIECLIVERVTAAFSNTVPVQIELHVAGQRWDELSDSDFEMEVQQWRAGGELFVAVFRRIVPVSRAVPAPYETTIPLEGWFEAGSYAVHVNNYTLEIAIPDAPPPGRDGPPPRDQLERRYATVTYVDLIVSDSYPARLTLHAAGYFDAGCSFPPQVEQRRGDRRVLVEIYCLFDPQEHYTEFLPLNEYVRLDGGFERGTYTIQVNDYITAVSIPFPPPPPPPPEPVRRYAVIENVEVLLHQEYARSVRLTLHVTGYYSEGCQGPLQIEWWRAESRVRVEIYVLVNPAILCPEMLVPLDEYIPLEDPFESGRYTITVNDYTLHLTL